jgi:phosphoribosylaminoimidazole-succinocarboxamide synthase
VLTPDASRFWYKGDWAPGKTPPSYDKQIVRNHLLTLDWDKTPPGPTLPSEITEKAGARYREIADRLMG